MYYSIFSYTVNGKKICCGSIFAIFTGTITLRKYSPRIVHHVTFVTLDFTIDLLWNFLTLRYYQAVLGVDLPDPKGPLTMPIPRQATAEASKQVHTAAIAKALKKRGNGCFNVKTSTCTGKYSCENN